MFHVMQFLIFNFFADLNILKVKKEGNRGCLRVNLKYFFFIKLADRIIGLQNCPPTKKKGF